MTGEVIDRPLATTLIAAATGGSTSAAFQVRTQPTCVAVTGVALTTGETVTIQRQDAGGTWLNYVHTLLGPYVISGSDTPPESALTIYDTGIYRAVKTATAGATGVEIMGREFT